MMVFQAERSGWLRSMPMTLLLGASRVVRSQKKVPSLSMGSKTASSVVTSWMGGGVGVLEVLDR